MNNRSLCEASVLDDSVPGIRFNAEGVSQYFLNGKSRIEKECFRGDDGAARLAPLVERIKLEGRGKPYDCVIGLSGGVDSTYVALRAKELGLRPIAVHLDNGWNTDVAVSNIEKTLRKLDIDLETHVVNWEEIKDLQRSFFQASIINVEAITDHAIYALMHRATARWGIRFILPGTNLETEAILPPWEHPARDSKLIKTIHRRYGRLGRLKSFPLMGPQEFLWHTLVRRVRNVPVLNFGPYNKAEVIERLKTELDWTPYARKHGESRFTRFYQEYYLPEKFGIDKRKAHYSTLIAAGQMKREEALASLNDPLYRAADKEIDIEYVTKKLGFTESEWAGIMAAPEQPYSAFENHAWLYDADFPLARRIKAIARGQEKSAEVDLNTGVAP